MDDKTLILILIFAFPVLIAQGTWIFKDAKKREEKHYWLWGLFGILNVPSSLIIYLLVTRIILKGINKN